MTAAATTSDEGPLGIVAGSGRVPVAIAEQVTARGRPVYIVGLEGLADETIESYPFVRLHPYEIDKGFKLLRERGVKELVLGGQMFRPRFRQFRVDLGTLRFLKLYFVTKTWGDDSLISYAARMIDQHGFKVLSLSDVAPEFVAPLGPIGQRVPTEAQIAEMTFGVDVARTSGRFDIGQATVVDGQRVIAIEAAEGTDAMIDRCGVLRGTFRWNTSRRSGLLVKVPKPQQELRNDMPVIGPATIERAIAAGLTGIVVEAGGVLLLDVGDMVRLADEAGLFIYGVPRGESGT